MSYPRLVPSGIILLFLLPLAGITLETHASLVKPFLAGPQPQFGGGKTHRLQEATFNQMGEQGFAGDIGRESLGYWPGGV